MQFAQSERNKVQSAYDALKKQWEENFVSCGKGTKVSEPSKLVKVFTQAFKVVPPQFEWSASNFSLEYHYWIIQLSHENKGNDRQLEKLLIV